MQRLFPALNITDKSIQADLKATMHVCNLAPEEFLPAGLPKFTWIFVEKGFIKKSTWIKNILDVVDLLPEGTCLMLTNPSITLPKEPGSFIQAIEPSTLYYLLPSEIDTLGVQYHQFGWGHMTLIVKSAEHLNKLARIWQKPNATRFEYVKTNHPYLLRAGPGPLADYLRLTGKEYTALLSYFN